MSTDHDIEESVAEPTGFRALGWLLAVGGLIAFAASFRLVLDKLKILDDPEFVPVCDIGGTLSCSTIMKTPQAEVFGFPNPLLGIIGFAVVITIGVIVLSGTRLPEWIWAGFSAGTIFGIGFVHWLIYQSLFVIKFLCPWCMVVWAMMIPIFWYVSLRNLSTWFPENRVIRFLRNWHALFLLLWIIVISSGAFWRYGM